MDIKRVWLAGLCCVWGAACAAPSAADEHVEPASAAQAAKLDLLLVIDNSNTMLEEQAKWAAQVPRLVETLVTADAAPVRDLHVGVVSSDMGWPGTQARASCAANGGDDGRLRHSGARALDGTCASEYPLFLSYEAGQSDPMQLAHDVRCITEIGTNGCSVEQPLEAALRALSPQGRAELEPAFGGNVGFLRDDSLLVVVLLTDEDDCSIADASQFKLSDRGERDPDLGEDINRGCIKGVGLHDVRERYLKGFRALRPGREDLVVFLAIAGVPTDLVDEQVLANTDFADTTARDQFFDAILKDSRMQPGIDLISPPEQRLASLRPSCITPPDLREVQPHLAFPAPRIVELAKSFGENGMVQSICSDDYGRVVDALLRAVVRPRSH